MTPPTISFHPRTSRDPPRLLPPSMWKVAVRSEVGGRVLLKNHSAPVGESLDPLFCIL